jgi:hypothetical protein
MLGLFDLYGINRLFKIPYVLELTAPVHVLKLHSSAKQQVVCSPSGA